jgi:hypothetical protein
MNFMNNNTQNIEIESQPFCAQLGYVSSKITRFFLQLQKEMKVGQRIYAQKVGEGLCNNRDYQKPGSFLPKGAQIVQHHEIAIHQDERALYIKVGNKWVKENIGKQGIVVIDILLKNKRSKGHGQMRNYEIANEYTAYIKGIGSDSSISNKLKKLLEIQEKYECTPIIIKEGTGKKKRSIVTYGLNPDLDGFSGLSLDSSILKTHS